MSQSTFSLDHITQTSYGGVPIKCISVSAVRDGAQWTSTVDAHGNLVWTYNSDKKGVITVVTSANEQLTLATLNATMVAQDVNPIAVPPLPFTSIDKSKEPAASVTCPLARLMGPPQEGYMIQQSGEKTLTWLFEGLITLVTSGYKPD